MALVHKSLVGRGGGSHVKEIHDITLSGGTGSIVTGLKAIYSVQLTYNEAAVGTAPLAFSKSGGTVTVYGDTTADVNAVIEGY